jgi:hypothetical protein
MALTPALAALLLEGGSRLPSTIGTLLPTANDRSNRARRKEIERLAAADALGLTAEDLAVERTAQEQEMEADRRALDASRRSLLAGAGAGSGEALESAIAAEQAQLAQQQRLSENLQAQDREREEEQLDELDQLINERTRRQFERRQALGDLSSAIGESAQDFLGFVRTTGQTRDVAEAEARRKEGITHLIDTYGINPDKAEAAYDYLRENSDLFRE